jgi:hypothetical protein
MSAKQRHTAHNSINRHALETPRGFVHLVCVWIADCRHSLLGGGELPLGNHILRFTAHFAFEAFLFPLVLIRAVWTDGHDASMMQYMHDEKNFKLASELIY